METIVMGFSALLKIARNDLVPLFFAHHIAVDLDAARDDQPEILGVATEHDVLFEAQSPVLEFLGQGVSALY